MQNSKEEDYNTKQLAAVQECRRNLKDFGFRLGVSNLRVLSPWGSIHHLGEDVWARDGVHLTEPGYDAIASMVVQINAELSEKFLEGTSKRERKREEADLPVPRRTIFAWSGGAPRGRVRFSF